MIKRVEHVGIIVSNMDESIQFYQDIMTICRRTKVHVKNTSRFSSLFFGDRLVLILK